MSYTNSGYNYNVLTFKIEVTWSVCCVRNSTDLKIVDMFRALSELFLVRPLFKRIIFSTL